MDIVLFWMFRGIRSFRILLFFVFIYIVCLFVRFIGFECIGVY